MQYYVYIYLNPFKPGKYNYSSINTTLDYEPFYIGEGCRGRVYQHLGLFKSNKNSNKENIITNMLENFDKQTIKDRFIKILKTFNNKDDALQYEAILINEIGRTCNKSGCLTNLKPYSYNTLRNISKYNNMVWGETFVNILTKQKHTVPHNVNIYDYFYTNFEIGPEDGIHLLFSNKVRKIKNICNVKYIDTFDTTYELYVRGEKVTVNYNENYVGVCKKYNLPSSTISNLTRSINPVKISYGVCLWENKDLYYDKNNTPIITYYELCVNGTYVKFMSSENFRDVARRLNISNLDSISAIVNGDIEFRKDGLICLWENRLKYFNENGDIKIKSYEVYIDGHLVIITPNDNLNDIERKYNLPRNKLYRITTELNKTIAGGRCYLSKYHEEFLKIYAIKDNYNNMLICGSINNIREKVKQHHRIYYGVDLKPNELTKICGINNKKYTGKWKNYSFEGTYDE